MSKIKLIKRNGKWYNSETGKQFIGVAFINGQQYHFNFDGTKTLWYRGRPAEMIHLPFKQGEIPGPKRIRENSSPTKSVSELYEDGMKRDLVKDDLKYGSSNSKYDIPFIPEKAILINGSTTSTNVLDSLAKYAGMHNANPQLSSHPILSRDKYPIPKQISKNEMLGLAGQETHFGAQPTHNIEYRDKNNRRALMNTNYFTAFGYIPAENLVRNFQYNTSKVDRSVPPLLDAFQYYAQGDYNRGDSSHTSDINNTGQNIWKNPDVQKWWKQSGQYWYNEGQKTVKQKHGGQLPKAQFGWKAKWTTNYNDWIKTVPNDRKSNNYNLKRAFYLAPKEELEAWRKSSVKDLKAGKNHLNTAYEISNGDYEFMKAKNHPTVFFEHQWYNSKDGESFRKEYEYINSNPAKYIRKKPIWQ